ncbi:MAG: hypothetical protein CTY35_00175 [Methylotenera sp.]|uniref:hypothetical protein n=1 Tax=Methylotenera sp. TaxID=2051956 RepID=UPI000D445ED0|nr:hypothetical protein [Methylotenera sp.]PPC84772.1 MAG: hypothetical protein CTY38_00175 [Methylotenera sp.]PPD02131.1 MAG: hypothetical protein CTY35_00175 [Methylotenera sp.]
MTQETLDFVTELDMRARLTPGGHQLMMAFDRIACPIPLPGNKSAILMKGAAESIHQWGKTLPTDNQKTLQTLMTTHIKNSVVYLKQKAETAAT